MPPDCRHGHRSQQAQRHRLKGFGEVLAEAFPRRRHPVDFSGALASCSWQQTPDFALMLEDVEMPPNDFLDMIVGLHSPIDARSRK